MQESHVANAMQENDGQEEQLFRILEQNPVNENEHDILDTNLEETFKESEDQDSKTETKNILDQEATQGGKLTCNGIPYVLCFASPKKTIIWNLQNHSNRKKKPEQRDLKDEMVTSAKD